jgi:hypothetical protein
MKSKKNSTPDQVFSYIGQMLIEMRIMSENANAPVLAYLIEMAIIEAGDTSGVDKNSVSPVRTQISGIEQLLRSGES